MARNLRAEKLITRENNESLTNFTTSSVKIKEMEMKIEESDENRESNWSSESENLTYNLSKPTLSQVEEENTKGSEQIRPVPAPRKRVQLPVEPEKLSSDTDKDITEIDLDETKTWVKQNDCGATPTKKVATFDRLVEKFTAAPTPIPRKLNKEKKNSVESGEGELRNTETSDKENKELPLVKSLHSLEENFPKSERKFTEKLKKETEKAKIFPKSKKLLFSGTDVEGKKISNVSSILKDFKRETKKKIGKQEDKEHVADERLNFSEFDSEAKIYVQSNNGFQMMEKDQVLGKKKPEVKISQNIREMNESTVKAAVLFQKYWSRSMEFFQGILAGFAVSHAAVVSALMVHLNFQPRQFFTVYSHLSLKVHFIFYFLTTLSIASCLDRIDIGHINKKHWQIIWKVSSMLFILLLYLVSFLLTFANHKQETTFEAFLHRNETQINEWEIQEKDELKAKLLSWYHRVWIRDILALLAWFFISLSKFKDFLQIHLSNMTKYTEHSNEGIKWSYQK